MTVLGTAVSDLSEMVLRNIEKTLKAERSKENERVSENNDRERDPVPPGRDDTDISSRLGVAGTEADRQVRAAPQDIPERTQEADLSGDAPERHSERASGGNGRNSEPEIIGDNAGTGSESGSDRGTQSERSDALGRFDEQSESAGGRTDNGGTDLQLNSRNEAVSELSVTASSLDKALELINEYTEREFGPEAE